MRARVEFYSTIVHAQLTGDFFLYPEEALLAVESSLKGLSPKATGQEIASAVSAAAEKHKVKMVGITPESIASVVRKALEAAE